MRIRRAVARLGCGASSQECRSGFSTRPQLSFVPWPHHEYIRHRSPRQDFAQAGTRCSGCEFRRDSRSDCCRRSHCCPRTTVRLIPDASGAMRDCPPGNRRLPRRSGQELRDHPCATTRSRDRRPTTPCLLIGTSPKLADRRLACPARAVSVAHADRSSRSAIWRALFLAEPASCAIRDLEDGSSPAGPTPLA